MKHIKTFESFLNEAATYQSLENDLRKTFEKTGVQKSCYDGDFAISASAWEIGHPNGSIGITFWLMEEVPTNKLDAVAKDWAKKNKLEAATFYPNGITPNVDPTKNQNWNNKAAQNANYVYGFTFYDKNYASKSVYTPLK